MKLKMNKFQDRVLFPCYLMPMKSLKLFFPLFLLLTLSAQAQTASWESFLGCYKTVSLNGHPVTEKQNDPVFQSYIKKTATDYWTVNSQTGEAEKLPTIEFRFFQRAQGSQEFADGSTIIFQSSDDQGSHFSYDGVPLGLAPDQKIEVHVRLDLLNLGKDLIQAQFLRTVPQFPAANVNDRYVLLKINCL